MYEKYIVNSYILDELSQLINNRKKGKKIKMHEKIFLSSPHMSDEGYEKEYIKEAFETNWIAPLRRKCKQI